jgi:predicted GNAT family N-acyltransferase
MLAGSDLVFALVDPETDRLAAFARVLTDDTYLALVLDVVVSAGRRDAGVGRVLMDAIVAHPRIVAAESVELVCQPEFVDFYRRWGFTDDVGGSLLMRRT